MHARWACWAPLLSHVGLEQGEHCGVQAFWLARSRPAAPGGVTTATSCEGLQSPWLKMPFSFPGGIGWLG